MEKWKDVPGYEGLYQISTLGEVKSLARRRFNTHNNSYSFYKEKILSKRSNGRYYMVSLNKDSKSKNIKIHRLVTQAFILNPENKPQVNHKDGNKLNNHIENLEWCTPSENVAHAIMTNLITFKKGGKHHAAKKIIQYDNNAKIVNKYCSISEAVEQGDFKQPGISKCCQGITRQYKGFIWKYQS